MGETMKFMLGFHTLRCAKMVQQSYGRERNEET